MTHRGGAREAGATRWGVRRGTALLSIFLLAMFGLVGTPSFAEHKPSHNPGGNGNGNGNGNEGTVKINSTVFGNGPGHSGGSGGTPGTPSNDPHIPCSFDIEWFQFQGGETSTVTFELWSPTKTGRTMTPSGAQPGVLLAAPGENGWNATQNYTLAFTGPAHPVHGYHVKITVNTPDDKPGNADVKHKVFWVEGCDDEPPGGETDECPELDGNQPEGTICLPPANAEQRDNTSLDCPTDTVTTVFEERTEGFEFNFETNEWDSTGFSDWEVVDTDTRPANNQECPPEIEGEEDEIPGKDSPNEPNPVEVAGEQAAVTPPAAPPATAPTSVPTSVNAGLGETVAGQSGRSPFGLLMVMFGALLTAAAASRRRARA